MKLTWFGHAAFRIDYSGAAVLIDPFLRHNPSFTGDFAAAIAGVTHIVLTHGHADHFGDTLEIARLTGATVVGNAEIAGYVARHGGAPTEAMNSGGTVDLGRFRVSLVQALHSSSIDTAEGRIYLGNPHGVVLAADGAPTVYHMGDTDIFGDMALVEECHHPRIGLVPIGDRFTMGGRTAALACRRYFQFETIVPCHYGTFPLIDRTADAFVAAMGDDMRRVVVPAIGKALDL